MYDEQSRINAMISYFFLAPLFLFAKRDTPLGEPFVNAHARRASWIMLGGILAYTLFVLISPILSAINIFGISLTTTVLALLVSILLIVLIHGAYRAYHGIEATAVDMGISWKKPETTLLENTYSEEQKIRIVAAFIPFLGIILAEKYPLPEIYIARKVSNTVMTVFLVLSVFMTNTTLLFFLTLFSIVLVVVTAVYLFGFSRFLYFSFYDRIPSYAECEAHLQAIWLTSIDTIRIAFGKEKQ